MATRDFVKATRMPAFHLIDQRRKIRYAGNVSRSSIRRDIHLHALPHRELLSPDVAEFRGATESYSDFARSRLPQHDFQHFVRSPEFDTPEILKQYAQHAGADPAIWAFATGDRAEIHSLTSGFSILVQPEAGTISHSLATALIDRDEKIAKIWRGNGWTPGEVITALEPQP